MLDIIFTSEIAEQLKALLNAEVVKGKTHIRIYEVKTGTGWYARTELRLSPDSPSGGIEVNGIFSDIPFIISQDFINFYGECYEILSGDHCKFFIIAHERMDFLLLTSR